ncbi:hypothetical protein FGO68_gene15540 [Halteria grandinella]|uniref:Phospholipase/carboxylesterase/thioesterase domain-containing protein n=1 Tax=Halteria grandinella TaxID=5974 RepID=A0A8J8T154_HALGN|nr:hypothetical protein FGO68_gene15540 [Halteria grandinella]
MKEQDASLLKISDNAQRIILNLELISMLNSTVFMDIDPFQAIDPNDLAESLASSIEQIASSFIDLKHPLLYYQQYHTTFLQWWLFYFLQFFMNLSDMGDAILAHTKSLFGLITGSPVLNQMTIGLRSPAKIYYPSSGSDFGLLVFLHGFGSSGQESGEWWLQLNQLNSNYAVITPNGIKNPQGTRYWSGSDACCDVLDQGVDDSKYVRKLIQTEIAKGSIDPKKIFVSGHSNGGFMSYHFACENSDLIAGIIVISGQTFLDNIYCQGLDKSGNPRKISVLHIHGTADETILYEGGSILGAEYPSVAGSISRWQENLGCTVTDLELSESITIDSNNLVTEVYLPVASSCPAGTHIEHWKMINEDHVPAFSNAFRTKLASWLDAHPKLV